MRVVLDTNVMVAAIRSDKGASRQLLVTGLTQGYVLLASVPLMFEYEAVLTRAEHLAAAGVSVQDVADLLDAVASVAESVELDFLWRPLLPDPDDDMVFETAANGRADWLVTFNTRHFSMASRRFRIRVLTPAEAVAGLGEPE